jgi:hypothetical protein
MLAERDGDCKRGERGGAGAAPGRKKSAETGSVSAAKRRPAGSFIASTFERVSPPLRAGHDPAARYSNFCGNWLMMPALSMSAMWRICVWMLS